MNRRIMKGMKKKLNKGIVTALLLCFVLLISACNVNMQNGTKKSGIRVVTTIFPEYDWVISILGENPGNIEVEMLLDNGVDLHSYQPTAEDIVKISDCDMFIYVGGESDEWVEDVLKEAANKDMVVINMLEVLGNDVKAEEIVEGMEHEHEEGEEHEEDEEEMDEHVWLSLRHAARECDAIANGLKQIDPANADTYQANLEDYKESLNALDEEYAAVVEASENKTILFGDRFPFRYLADDYDLTYYAAFAGCSAETEASFKTILFLAEKTNEYELPVILTIEGSDERIAGSVRENTKEKNQEIMTLDSMQSVTGADVAAGAKYVDIMQKNLEVLKKALK